MEGDKGTCFFNGVNVIIFNLTGVPKWVALGNLSCIGNLFSQIGRLRITNLEKRLYFYLNLEVFCCSGPSAREIS